MTQQLITLIIAIAGITVSLLMLLCVGLYLAVPANSKAKQKIIQYGDMGFGVIVVAGVILIISVI